MKKMIFVFLMFSSFFSHAQIRLAPIFGDHMVLQQQAKVPVWGWAGPLQEISITGSWDNITIKAIANHNARWNVTLQTPKAGGPYTVTLKTTYETITLNDVMIGEVWLCSGQSNMEWSVYNGAADAAEEAPHANYPNIRLYHINKSASEFPQMRNEGSWQLCTPGSMKGFSAVGYFFGKKLHLDLNVPIGLINSSWGGTQAEAWTPDSLVINNPRLLEASLKKPQEPWGTKQPGHIFNAMIHPLMPFRIAGIIWYQGESNARTPDTYKELMENMIAGWRRGFNHFFPFYYVQIAPYAGYGEDEKSYLLREQQTNMLTIPNTGMVVISDVVDNVNDIHPKYKRPVGERLANYALAETYGKQGLVYKSPLYKSMTIQKNKIVLTFDNCPNGLISKGEPTEFSIAGEDRRFVRAKAVIKNNTMIVSSKEVKKPVAVRFAWSNGSIPNLFSKEGLPVPCFRTDDWSD